MLNKEKFAKEIMELALNHETVSITDNGELIPCGRVPCDYCKLYNQYDWSSNPFVRNKCKGAFIRWANSEYKEIDIDWDRVPVDTPVLVWDTDDKHKKKRYYAGLNDGYYMAFNNGTTSWSSDSVKETSLWSNCELARKEDIQKYRKR